jgi:hypothetical protein
MAHTTTLFIIIKNKKTKNMATLLAPGQTATGTLTLLDDETSANVGGWFTGISITSSDASKATAVPNTSSTSGKYIDFTGHANGTATITITATANYANSNGDIVAQVKTVSVDIEVASAAHSTTLKIVF